MDFWTVTVFHWLEDEIVEISDEICSWAVDFKNHPNSAILQKKAVAFKPEL